MSGKEGRNSVPTAPVLAPRAAVMVYISRVRDLAA